MKVLGNVCCLGTFRVSSRASEINPESTRPDLEYVTVEDLFKKAAKGLPSSSVGIKGWAQTDLEQQLLDAYDGQVVAVTAALPSADPVAYMLKTRVSGIQWRYQAGELAMFEAKLRPTTELYMGRPLFNAIGGPGIQGATTGPALQMGAVPPGWEAIVTYHVSDPPGLQGVDPTLDGVIETDVDTAFLAPMTRIVLPQVTGLHEELFRIDGDQTEITDTCWRVRFTNVGGTDPVFWPVLGVAVRRKLT